MAEAKSGGIVRKRHIKLFVHIVWSTWDNLPLITESMEPRLFEIIGNKIHDTKCQLLAVNGVADHVHALVLLDASASVGDVAQQLKDSSARRINREIGPVGSFRWHGSFSAFSVSPDGVPAVAEYIRDQKQHHAAGTLKEDWEQVPILETEPPPVPARRPRRKSPGRPS